MTSAFRPALCFAPCLRFLPHVPPKKFEQEARPQADQCSRTGLSEQHPQTDTDKHTAGNDHGFPFPHSARLLTPHNNISSRFVVFSQVSIKKPLLLINKSPRNPQCKTKGGDDGLKMGLTAAASIQSDKKIGKRCLSPFCKGNQPAFLPHLPVISRCRRQGPFLRRNAHSKQNQEI